MAPRIAKVTGATMLGSASNAADWEGRRVVIKCARYGTTSIGVTYRMLEQLDVIVAAFQRSDGQFDLFELSPAAFKQLMRPTHSTGASAGRVGIVTAPAIRRVAKPLRTIEIEPLWKGASASGTPRPVHTSRQ